MKSRPDNKKKKNKIKCLENNLCKNSLIHGRNLPLDEQISELVAESNAQIEADCVEIQGYSLFEILQQLIDGTAHYLNRKN